MKLLEYLPKPLVQLFQRSGAEVAVRSPNLRDLFGEAAWADPKHLFPGGWAQYNPSELVSRKGLEIFDKMRNDDQVKAALLFKKHSVLSSGWEVVSPEGQPEDWEVTEFVKWCLMNTEIPLEESLYSILSALDYGFSVSEKVFYLVETGPWAGRACLKAIKTRSPHFFFFNTDAFGNLVSLRQQGTTEGQVADSLPIEKFAIYVYQQEFGNWYGKSDLEAAYRAWITKDWSYKWLAMLLERLGIPPIFALYNPDHYLPAQETALKKAIKNLQAATFGAIPRPKDNSLEFWAPELAGQATRVFIPALDMFNKDISRAILMPGLLGATPDAAEGSYARSKVHFDVFMLIVENLKMELSRKVVQAQVVKQLVDLNYGTQEAYPLWRFKATTQEIRLDILESWNALLGSGAVTAQKEDEPHIRTLLQFPEKNEETVLKPKPKPKPKPGEDGNDDENENGRGAVKPYGGQGSGNWGHEGRPGAVGGSGEGGESIPDAIRTDVNFVREKLNELPSDLFDKATLVGSLAKQDQERMPDRGGPGTSDVDIILTAADSPPGSSWEAKAKLRDRQNEAVVKIFRAWQSQSKRSVELRIGDVIEGDKTLDVWRSRKKYNQGALKKSFSYANRLSNGFESQTNFNRIDRSLTRLQDQAKKRLVATLEAMRDGLTEYVGRHHASLKAELIETVKLKGAADLQADLREFLHAAYDLGVKELLAELPKQYAKEEPTFAPKDALKYLNAKAVTVAGVMKERVLKDVKQTLYNALKYGETQRETMQKLEDLFEPWVGDDSVLRDGEPLRPNHLENIVRTNATDAFNQGRLVQARDPDVVDFLVGMEYSSVLDSRTTEICRLLDGKVIPMNHPELDRLTPPNHFQCRSILIPVTLDVQVPEEDFITEAEVGEARSLIQEGFK